MKFLYGLYAHALKFSKHPYARFYLMTLAFCEAFFLPVSPAVLQVPMTFFHPEKAWDYCVCAIIGSILGAVIGYFIGHFFMALIIPVFQDLGYYPHYLEVVKWFHQWGFYILFLLSLSPSPYKITTIVSGAVGLPFTLFILISGVGRILHFSIVSYVLSASHTQRLKQWMIRRYSKKVPS